MRPRPLTTPLGDPEGPRRRASPARWCRRSCLLDANGCRFASYIPKGKSGAVQRWRMGPTVGILPHMAAPRHPLAGPVCLVFWADRGPGASCPYGEGPRRALVTFPRWKVTRGSGGAAPQSYSQARFDVSPPQAALGPGWRSTPQISSHKYRHLQPAGGSHGGLALRFLNVRRRCPPFLLTEGGRAC